MATAQGEDSEGPRWTVQWYQTVRGQQPGLEFLHGLTEEKFPRHRRDMLVLLGLLRDHGNQMPGNTSSSLGEGLFEARRFQVRLFYVFRPGRRIIVLYGVIKKSDAIPKDELDLARFYQRDLRKRGG